jgi:hypothetical protein
MLHVPKLVGNPKSIHIGKVSYNTMDIINFVEHRMLDQLNAYGELHKCGVDVDYYHKTSEHDACTEVGGRSQINTHRP